MRSTKMGQGDERYAPSTCLTFGLVISFLSVEAAIDGLAGGLCQPTFRWVVFMYPLNFFMYDGPIVWPALAVGTFLAYLILRGKRRSKRNNIVALCALFGVPACIFGYLYFILPNPAAGPNCW